MKTAKPSAPVVGRRLRRTLGALLAIGFASTWWKFVPTKESSAAPLDPPADIKPTTESAKVVVIAIPVKRSMINAEQLRFPSGLVCAETIRTMHGSAKGGLEKARALIAAGITAAAVGNGTTITMMTTFSIACFISWPPVCELGACPQ